MGEYFPLEALKILTSEESSDDFKNVLKDIGFIEDGVSADELRTFALSKDFMKPTYSGRYSVLNTELLKNVKFNKTLIPNVKMKDIESRKTDFRDYICCRNCVEAWSRFKIVYKIDNDFFHELKNTENLKLTKDIFECLPCQDIYIDLSDVKYIEPFMGCWVHIEDFGVYKTAAFYMIDENCTSFSYYSSFWFGEDGNATVDFVRSEMPSGNYQKVISEGGIPVDIERISSPDPRQDIITTVIQLLTFISAKIDDVIESPVTKNTYKKTNTVKNRFSEVMIWDVGARYGKAIRAAKDEVKKRVQLDTKERESSGKPRKPIRPHVRCAHWQRYHVGEGRKEIRVNWIPPTYVCGNKDIGVVVHKIKK